MGTLSGGQLRVLPSDGMGISCPASEPARPSLLPKFSSGTVVPLRPVDWGLDFQQQPGILADDESQAQLPFDRIRQGVVFGGVEERNDVQAVVATVSVAG
jgi:hypothetical protein